jgi:uncharacterized protein YeeX (DUF496 family)
MLKRQKKSNKFTKARDGITITPLRDATAAQLQKLFKTVYLKYVVTLENQLQEDKSHLLLKENTIQILQEEIKSRSLEYKDAYEDCLKKNDEFVIQNGELIKERDEITRAYNGLHMMGKIAQDQGINIEKYKNKLPENNIEFEHEHKLLESGKVQHSYKFKIPPKSKTKN